MLFWTLFALFVTFLGDSSGLWATLPLLFQNIPVSGPFSGRLKVAVLVIPARVRNRPILRQEITRIPARTKPGPRAASSSTFLTKVDPRDQECHTFVTFLTSSCRVFKRNMAKAGLGAVIVHWAELPLLLLGMRTSLGRVTAPSLGMRTTLPRVGNSP